MAMPEPPSASPGHVLGLIHRGEAVTRGQVMRATGLSRSTVVQRLGVLYAAGLLVDGDQRGEATGGRRPGALSLNRNLGVVLAADLGASHGRLAVCDLAGAALAVREEKLRIADGPESVLEWVGATFDALLAECRRSADDVLAIGLDVPGPVDVDRGRPVRPPIMPGWDDWPVADFLSRRFAVPVRVERDVQAMALGEHRRFFADVPNFVFVKVATGVGAGIIADGKLLQGTRGRAGDIGHIRSISPSDVLCTCGGHGCVGAVASGSAIVRQLNAAGYDVRSSVDVVELVEAGDATATHLVREAGRILGVALAALVSIVAPTALVIGGDLSGAADVLVAGIRESIYQRSSPLATEQLQILTSSLGASAGVVGAYTLALEYLLEPSNVDALLARRGRAS